MANGKPVTAQYPQLRRKVPVTPPASTGLPTTDPQGPTTSETRAKPDGNHRGAACVLSDSGTISEESTMLGFPAVTLRSSIERSEDLDTGADHHDPGARPTSIRRS